MTRPLPDLSPSVIAAAFASLPPRVQALEPSRIIEVAERAHGRRDVIRLYAGESDLPTPAFIVEAAVQALRDGHTGYQLSRGVPELREAIARYHRRVYGVDLDSDRVSITVGGMQAISQALLAVLSPGDEILVPVPVWPNILEAARVAGVVPIQVPMHFESESGWELDLQRLFDAVGPATRALFINSPGNPTGATLSDESLDRILAFARERGLWIIADEVYNRMVYDGRSHAPSLIPRIGPEDRVLVTNTFSKNWSMTGWRCGWVIAPRSMGVVWDNLLQYGTTGATTFVQHAAITAIDEGDTHIAEAVASWAGARRLIHDALAALPNVRVAAPAGAFYLFFSLDGLRDSRRFAFDLLEAKSVALAPGVAFTGAGEGWLRLCFGVSHQTLSEAASRLQAFIGSWPGQH
ncbi:MAG: pyridoxal phosphate-dependent aminotransferase [Burkholderiaceae bacterium]